ncbi:MAG: MBL fold metallo-hydrolase [Bacteroidota bacterium]
MNIHTIDLQFQGLKDNIAAFLVESPAGPFLVETGPHSTLPHLLAGIKAAGYEATDIKHVFITHIHLDHAGAAWWFAQQGAKVYVHPRGSKHLGSPERLMESARRIYLDKMDELWGEMNAIDPARIQEVAHEEIINIGDLKVRALHTPGHAVHHIAWRIGDIIFTGDVAGVRINQGMVIPPCPPPDIHIGDWENSIEILKAQAPRTLYLTHFGPIDYDENHLKELQQRLHKWANWIKPHYEAQRSVMEVTPEFQQMVAQDMIEEGIDEAERNKYEAANPSWMSVAGLMRYWKKQEQ